MPKVKMLRVDALKSWALLALMTTVGAAPLTVQQTTNGGVVYTLANNTYFANAQYPKTSLVVPSTTAEHDLSPITVIVVNQTTVSGKYLESTIASYLAGDDVFNEGFLANVYLSSSAGNGSNLDDSALQYLKNLQSGSHP